MMMDFLAQPVLVAALSANVARWVVWGGLVAATIALLVLMRTQWGSSQPLRKCIVLSLLVHLLFGIYTTTVSIVVASIGKGDGGDAMWVNLDGSASGDDNAQGDADRHGEAAADGVWNRFASPDWADDRFQAPKLKDEPPIDKFPGQPPRLNSTPLDRVADKLIDRADKLQVPRLESPRMTNRSPAEEAAAEEVSPAMRNDRKADPSFESAAPPDRFAASRPTENSPAGPTDLMRSPLDMAADLVPPRFESDELTPKGTGSTKPIADRPASGGTAGDSLEGALVPIVKGGGGDGGNGSVPTIMKGRVGSDRLQRAIANGGSQDTEAAVVAALKWLAEHQGRDGRWDADQFEAGREVMVNGHDRRGAGSHADAGITGLALLAFLAHGNTHLKGEHPKSVQRGLEWLLSIQGADGNLAGDATIYERMYCHAMATCALSEAYAMSGDDRLAAPVRQAIGYCIRAQDRAGGGWRYQPGDAGDTSQLGWQVMALKSAQLAGIETPSETRSGMVRFLKNVSSGTHGGLASYKPGHRVTHTMTAEALVCRQFIGMGRDNPASNEAGDYVLSLLPGEGDENVYYWYYGTLGMFQLQGNHWKTWNKALQESLLGTQRNDGDFRGSWDPDRVWGAYGGRVYSTALSCLCLEVYYRFLPLYVEAASRERRTE